MYNFKTPNPHYTGKTLDVEFENGLGQTDNEEIKNILINDFGYKLFEEVTQEEPKKETKKGKQSPKKEGE